VTRLKGITHCTRSYSAALPNNDFVGSVSARMRGADLNNTPWPLSESQMEHPGKPSSTWHGRPRATRQFRRPHRRAETDGLAVNATPWYLVIELQISSRSHTRKSPAITDPRDAMHLGAAEIETTQTTCIYKGFVQNVSKPVIELLGPPWHIRALQSSGQRRHTQSIPITQRALVTEERRSLVSGTRQLPLAIKCQPFMQRWLLNPARKSLTCKKSI
jgi:hypothetical protein